MAATEATADADLWVGISATKKKQILASDVPHLEYLRAFIGLREIKGSKHQAIIVLWGQAAGIDWWNNDDDPWCAVGVNGSVVAVGGTSSRSAMARSFSWDSYPGTRLTRPVKGAIGVIPRGRNETFGHTFLIDEVSGGTMRVIEGNASDMVKYGHTPVSSLVENGIIWPAGIPMTDEAKAAVAGARPRALGDRQLLKKGYTGDDVAELARALMELGAKPELSGTGYYGPKTEQAVKWFQTRTPGLEADGVAGPHTQAALQQALTKHRAAEADRKQAEKVRDTAKTATKQSTAPAVAVTGAAGAAAVGTAVQTAESINRLNDGTMLGVFFALIITIAVVGGVAYWYFQKRAADKAEAEAGPV